MLDRKAGPDAEVVMPVSDLHGRTVWSEAGQRIGTIRGINTDDDGRIVSFDVRERWFLGPHHEVTATDMRLDGGDVIVPTGAVKRDEDEQDTKHEHSDERVEHRGGMVGHASAPVLLAGREGVRGRFGGLDLLGSFFGALVLFASLLLIGGILSAFFGSEPANVDTAINSFDALLEEALLVGAAALFVSSFLGGWCAGRSARYDGVGNGLMSVVWTLAIIAGLGGLAAWLGEEYDVLAAAELPTFSNDEFATWGLIGFAAAIALMLVGAALGGALGESWHRRADRAMLDVVEVDSGDAAISSAGGAAPVASQSVVDDTDAVATDPDRPTSRERRRLE